MISVNWDNKRIKGSNELPQGWVFFVFKKDDQALWCGYTPNLAQRLQVITNKAESDQQYAEMSESANILQYESYPQAMDALILYKVFCHTQHPTFQNVIRPCSDYVYLALDAYRFPFVSLRSDTNDDWLYSGPWRSRFFLVDVLDSLSRILKIPFCETSSFPCDKLDNGVCRGYCLALDDSEPTPDDVDLTKLDALLREAYLHPNNGIWEMLKQEKVKYFNELEFAKEDLINDEMEILAEYRDWLEFLYATKFISFATETIKVEKGLLIWCMLEGVEYSFPPLATQFRDNEKLALNLQDVDEARIIYDYHIKHHIG